MSSAVLSGGGGEFLDVTVCAEAATAIVVNATICRLRTSLIRSMLSSLRVPPEHIETERGEPCHAPQKS
jgi:hypothetical protein